MTVKGPAKGAGVDERTQIAEELMYVAAGRGADFADVRIVEENSTRVAAEDGRADRGSGSSTVGAGIRVLVNGAWGFVSADTTSRRRLLAALDQAIELARTSSPRVTDPATLAASEPVRATFATAFRRDPRSVGAADKIAAVKSYEDAARKHGGSAIVNTQVAYSDAVISETIANTRGTLIQQQSTTVYLSCAVSVAKDELRQRGGERKGIIGGYELVDETQAEAFSIVAVDRALTLLSAKPAPGGMFPVIFDPSATGLFAHEALGHNAEADAVWTGGSILAGKMGEQIAAGCVTMVDDPTVEGAFGYYLYDSEGTGAKRHVIIENGVLKTFLHSLETAARFGVEPNGAARAEGHTARPIVRMSNTFVAPGKTSLAEMLRSIDRGIYLEDAQGGYVFPERGLFTCKAGQAKMIEHGQLGEPLRDVSAGGLMLEILKNIEMVGTDLVIDWPGFCGKGGQNVPTAIGGPHVKISQILVGGRQA